MSCGRPLRYAFAWALAPCLLAPTLALADTPPSSWDVARDPDARERWDLHETVRRDMAFDPDVGSLRSAALEHARALLEDADAAHSSDVRLRFDLGEVYERLDLHERAIAVLEPALHDAPDHPAATHTWVMAAYAYAHLDRPRDERAAYERYLERETDDRFRVTALLNLAEADMRLGFLPDAVAGYRETITLAVSLPMREGFMDEVLATWGLAVALDRNGDPMGAAAAARQATQIDQRIRLPGMPGAPDHGWRFIGDTQKVFFVPSYERYWYLAMGYTEDAKQAPDARHAAREWATAEFLWTKYVSQATSKDRWVPLARAHLERAHAERVSAEKRARTQRPASRFEGEDGEILIR
jgi:tetratricopeptide (TPR) repeat protein